MLSMPSEWTIFGRVALSFAIGFAIGWEREVRGAAAGDRTFALVSIGAAAFTAVGVENFPATAEKVMAGVVTVVGFLGGGMILRDGGSIRGLTTAAAIWATAAIGMLAGVGEFLIAGRFAELRSRDASLYTALAGLPADERNGLIQYLQSQVSLNEFEQAA